MQKTFNDLMVAMSDRSWTLGHDAVLMINRAKVNRLLDQQYVEHFNSNAFPKEINQEFDLNDDLTERLELDSLTLSSPQLSFDAADFSNSRATATFLITAGHVMYWSLPIDGTPPLLVNSIEIMPNHGYTVSMSVDLKESIGEVGDKGEVTIDIGEGFNCSCNLVVDSKLQKRVGDAFKAYFLEYMDHGHLRYKIGAVALDSFHHLAPRSFSIRTLPTPETRARAAVLADIRREVQPAVSARGLTLPAAIIKEDDDYGEGAVLVFITTKTNFTGGGTLPLDWPYDYPIPNDRDSVTGERLYSGGLFLSRKLVFASIIREAIIAEIGNGLALAPDAVDDGHRMTLQATAGGFELETIDIYEYEKYDVMHNAELSFKTYDPLDVSFAGEDQLAVTLESGQLKLNWDGQLVGGQRFKYTYNQAGLDDWFDKWFTCKAQANVNVTYDIVLKDSDVVPGGVQVGFKVASSSVDSTIDLKEMEDYLANLDFYMKWPNDSYDQVYGVPDALRNSFKSQFKSKFSAVAIPDIDILTLSDLLFPGQYALKFDRGAIPGDLVVYGHVDPLKVSTRLDPDRPMVKLGSATDFTLAGVQDETVVWKVYAPVGSDDVLGTIQSTGKNTARFTAPALTAGAGYNIVEARTEDAQGNVLTITKALVTLVEQAVIVSPDVITRYIPAGPKDEPVEIELEAQTLGKGPIQWSIAQGEGIVSPSTGETTKFIVTPNTTAVTYVQARDGAEVGQSCVLLAVGAFNLQVKPAFKGGLGPLASASFTVDDRFDNVEWTILEGGEGSLQVNGKVCTYTAPETITKPFAILQATLGKSGDPGYLQGFTTIGLSEHAPVVSEWTKAENFEIVQKEVTVLANGRMQAAITVRLKPKTENGTYRKLSASERASLRLFYEGGDAMLPVLEEGAEANAGWALTHVHNKLYKDYSDVPSQARGESAVAEAVPAVMPDDADLEEIVVYVQYGEGSSKDTEEPIVIAGIRPDGREWLMSTDSEASQFNQKVTLKAKTPPTYTIDGDLTLRINAHIDGKRDRVWPINSKPDDNPPVNGDDQVLVSLDYYKCKFSWWNKGTNIVAVKFDGKHSMLRWESPNRGDDVHSLVGYGVKTDTVMGADGKPKVRHHVEDHIRYVLAGMRSLPWQPKEPLELFENDSDVPSGSVTFSVQRREGWEYDATIAKMYDQEMKATFIDIFGSAHEVIIKFENDRNHLSIVPA